jgi:hypothetical protein
MTGHVSSVTCPDCIAGVKNVACPTCDGTGHASSNRAASIESVASAMYHDRHGMPLSKYNRSAEAEKLREAAAAVVDAIPNSATKTTCQHGGAGCVCGKPLPCEIHDADATRNRVWLVVGRRGAVSCAFSTKEAAEAQAAKHPEVYRVQAWGLDPENLP